jgi:hypothetical protein
LELNDRTTEVPDATPKGDCRTSTESGISIEEQQGDGIENINRILDGESNVSACNPGYSMKQYFPMVSTEPGMQTDRSEHQANVRSPICESLIPDSKATFSSDVQCEKQLSPRISTEDGIQIDFSDEQPSKVEFSIRMRLEGDSKVTLARNSGDDNS